jgi:alpha-ketoglutarate-dependent taurine dioxygenase
VVDFGARKVTFPIHFGAEHTVSRLDILNDREFWRNELYDRKMLVFRDLHLTVDEYYELHTVFGRPWMKPLYTLSREVTQDLSGGRVYTAYGSVSNAAMGIEAMRFHRDIPFHRGIRYPIRSLYPVKLPAQNAATIFTDADVLWCLYPELHDTFMNTELIIHSWYDVTFQTGQSVRKRIPLVEQHPHTGRKSMLLNTPGPTGWVRGVVIHGEEQPLKVVEEWFSRLGTPDNFYRHEWQRGDLVIFDNYSGLMHGREAIASTEERAFWRMNLKHDWQL